MVIHFSSFIQPTLSKKKVMTKIMKAIRTNNVYDCYYWKRIED